VKNGSKRMVCYRYASVISPRFPPIIRGNEIKSLQIENVTLFNRLKLLWLSKWAGKDQLPVLNEMH